MDSLRTDNLNVRHPITPEILLDVLHQRLLVLDQPLGIIASVKLDLPLAVKLTVGPLVNVKVTNPTASVKGVHEACHGICDIFPART